MLYASHQEGKKSTGVDIEVSLLTCKMLLCEHIICMHDFTIINIAP